MIERWRKHVEAGVRPALSIRLAASFTADPFVPWLGCALLDLGLTAEVEVVAPASIRDLLHEAPAPVGFRRRDEPGAGPMGAPSQTELLRPQTPVGSEAPPGGSDDGIHSRRQPPDAVLVWVWRIEDLFPRSFDDYVVGSSTSSPELDQQAADLGREVGRYCAAAGCFSVVSTPPLPAHPAVDMSSADAARLVGLHRRIVGVFREAAGAAPSAWIDLDGLERDIGVSAARDPRTWYLFRQPFTQRFSASVGAGLATLIAAPRAKPIKAVVLDCDGTLWGGQVAEDGPAGLVLGDQFPGSAYRDFQRRLRYLQARGLLLAVCSRNEVRDVLEVFAGHDAMVLRREHLAAWRIGWQPKAVAIAEIAAELGVAVDSLAFVDDDPVEVAAAVAALPGLKALLVPEDTVRLPRLLDGIVGLEGLGRTAEDGLRGASVVSERARLRDLADRGRESFLLDLGLCARLFEATPWHAERLAQLMARTTQFNLAPAALGVPALEHLIASRERRLLCLEAHDRFGEYGLVGLAIVEQQPTHWNLERLLLSCRALGRGLETALLRAIAEDAADAGAATITARYVATARNGPARAFLVDHGFVEDGELWRATRVPPCPPHVSLARA